METLVLIAVLMVFDSVLIFFILKGYKNISTERKKAIIDKTIEEENNKKCMFVFIKCREKNIFKFDTIQELDVLKIIANSYDIDDLEAAKECYYKGKTLVETVEVYKQNKMIEELRQKDKKEFEDDERRAKIKGKEKYISSLEKIYRDALKKVKLANGFEENTIIGDNEIDYKKKDATIGEAYTAVSAYNSAKRQQREKIDEFNKKICDESNMEDKFKYLKFSNIKYLVLNSKNIRISGYVKIDEDIKLLGSDALLDGSLKISILDSNNKILGYGYYSTGVFQEGLLVDSGFTKHEKRFSSICIIDDYENINEDMEFKYKIEPVNMWLIEC